MFEFRHAAILLICASLLLGCAKQGPRVYENRTYEFAVTYPEHYKIREFNLNGEEIGAELSNDFGTITVRAMAAGTMYEGMKFDDYVLIAAASEIQNFEEISSYKKFRSLKGVYGYETFWQVGETIPPDEWREGMKPQTKIVGPIYYFPPKVIKFSGEQPVKTIMLSYYAKTTGEVEDLMKKDLIEIAKSFRYINETAESSQ